MKAIFTRAGKFIPTQRPGEYEFRYLRRLAQVIVHRVYRIEASLQFEMVDSK